MEDSRDPHTILVGGGPRHEPTAGILDNGNIPGVCPSLVGDQEDKACRISGHWDSAVQKNLG